MSSTDDLTQLIAGYIDGTLNDADQERVKAKLILSREFRNLYNDMKENIDVLKSVKSVAPPPGLEERVVSAMMAAHADQGASSSASGGWQSWLFSMKGMALVTTCLIAVVAVWNIPKDSNIALKQVVPEVEESVAVVDNLEAEADAVNDMVVAPAENQAQDRANVRDNKEVATSEVLQAKESMTEGKDQLTTDAPALKKAKVARKSNIPGVVAAQPVSAGFGARSAPAAPLTGRSLSAASQTDLEEANEKLERKKEANLELKGQISSILEPSERVISSKRDWKKLWKEHTAKIDEKGRAPSVDFKNNEIIALFAGTQGTGGNSIQLKNVEFTTWEGNPARVVTYRLATPPPNTFRTTVVTQPIFDV